MPTFDPNQEEWGCCSDMGWATAVPGLTRRNLPRTVLGGGLLWLCLPLQGQQLLLRWENGQLRLAAPGFHFLKADLLEQIRTGRSIAFDFQLTVLNEARTTPLRKAFERFVISYDLWEEKFSVARLRTREGSASRLTAEAAETWCLEHIDWSQAGLPPGRPLWFRLDIRAQDPRQQTPEFAEPGASLSSLIEIFSRSKKPDQAQSWRLESGPVVLQDLTKGGTRGGA